MVEVTLPTAGSNWKFVGAVISIVREFPIEKSELVDSVILITPMSLYWLGSEQAVNLKEGLVIVTWPKWYWKKHSPTRTKKNSS